MPSVHATARPAPPRPRLTAERLEDRDLCAILYVAPSGTDTPGGGRSPSAPLHSLQFAANQAASGDTIRLAAGSYTYDPAAAANPAVQALGTQQVLAVVDKRLAVYGGYSTADGFAAANPQANPTILDGQGQARGIMVVAGTHPTGLDLEGVTVRNGLARPITSRGSFNLLNAYGGGLFLDMGSEPTSTTPTTLRNDTFEGNRSVGNPADPTDPTLNFGGNGSGGAVYANYAQNLQLSNVVFRNNQAVGGDGGQVAGRALGGAIHTDYSTVTGDNLLFDGNTAVAGTTSGLGTGSGGPLEGHFTADATGGAAAFQLGSTATLTHVTMTHNQVTGGNTTDTDPQATGGDGYGAALFAELDTTVTVRDGLIADNLATGGQGYIAGLASGGGITFENASLVLDRVAVIRNRVVGGTPNNPNGQANAVTGGGMYLFSVNTGESHTPVETVTITNSLIADNRVELPAVGNVQSGGSAAGLRLNGVHATISHTTIADNTFGPNLFFGQAIMLQNDGATVPTVLNLNNSIVADHQPAAGSTSAAVTQFNGTTLNLDNNIFFNNYTDLNTFDLSGPGPDSTVPAVTTGQATTIHADPLFAAPGGATASYALQAGSPAIDRGDDPPGPGGVDIGNKPRVGAPDIGAFEFGTTLADLHAGSATGAATTVGPALPAGGLTPTYSVGTDAGGSGVVRSFNPDGTERFSVTPFPGFTGGVRVAEADFNGDGVADLVAGTGPGGPSHVVILDGTDRHVLFSLDPFEAAFTGGVYVAAGDVTGDGVPDLIVTPDEGGGPRVRVFTGAGFAQVIDFYGIDDPNFRGGARAAVGDVTGDGVGDLIVAAGFQGGPRVAGFDGKSLATGTPQKIFGDFYAFEQTLRNGVFLTVGDVNGDGHADIIAGGGPGGGPRVTVFDGKSLLANQQTPVADFFAGDPNNRGGVRLAAKDLDGDNQADLVVGSGQGAGSHVTAYYGKVLASGGTQSATDFDAFPGFGGGVFVG